MEAIIRMFGMFNSLPGIHVTVAIATTTLQIHTPSGSNSKKSYDNLPQEAKTACDRFIKNGWIKSKQEYIDSYDWT